MRDLFPGYLDRKPEEFAAIWKNCIFTFDANFLLDFYRSTPESQKTLFGILDLVKDRVRLTHQAALEFYRNREAVIRESSDSYDKVATLVKGAVSNIENGLKTHQKHTTIEVEQVAEIVRKSVTDVEKLLRALKTKHPDHTKRDTIEERLAKLFNGKVAPPYSEDALQAVFQAANQRYVDRIPPGYMDERQKDGNRRFGDVVLWFQVLAIAKEGNKPVIFVTADSKEDWWTKEGKPRPELIQEVFLHAKVMFHMYKPAQFVIWANKYLDPKKEAQSFEKAATELREIESQRTASAVDVIAIMKAVAAQHSASDAADAVAIMKAIAAQHSASDAAALGYLRSALPEFTAGDPLRFLPPELRNIAAQRAFARTLNLPIAKEPGREGAISTGSPGELRQEGGSENKQPESTGISRPRDGERDEPGSGSEQPTPKSD